MRARADQQGGGRFLSHIMDEDGEHEGKGLDVCRAYLQQKIFDDKSFKI